SDSLEESGFGKPPVRPQGHPRKGDDTRQTAGHDRLGRGRPVRALRLWQPPERHRIGNKQGLRREVRGRSACQARTATPAFPGTVPAQREQQAETREAGRAADIGHRHACRTDHWDRDRQRCQKTDRSVGPRVLLSRERFRPGYCGGARIRLGHRVRQAGTVRRHRADHLRPRGAAAHPGALGVLGVQTHSPFDQGVGGVPAGPDSFLDASRVGLHELRSDAGLYLRLLGIALPLTIGLGTLLALALTGTGDIWLALLVGAALAPTDAALGAGMMANPALPARIRRVINVESGLSDGIATPFVSVALAGAASGTGVAGHGPAAAGAELALGVLVGVAVGGAGGLLVSVARRRGWAAEGFIGSAGLGSGRR